MESRQVRADRIRPLVRAAISRAYPSQRQAAPDIGVTPQALGKFLKGETPYDQTLDLYDTWLQSVNDKNSSERGGDVEGDGWKADPRGTPAEQIIWYVEHMEDFRRTSGTTHPFDRVAAAYGLAAKQEIPVSEYRKLDAWRDHLLGGAA